MPETAFEPEFIIPRTAIKQIIQSQRDFFKTQKPDYSFRMQQLATLKTAIEAYESELLLAMEKDMRKPRFEGYLSDIAFTVTEIDLALKRLKSWMKPKRVSTPIAHLPGSSYIHAEPFGVTLVMAPWNYPIYLLLVPLIGAMAAGNCTVLKPSELTPNTSNVIAKMFKEYFDPAYIAVVEGDGQTAQELLNEKWDYIFFTGSPAIGKIVMQAAAQHLTPVTLELGGKSPCIVDKNINMETAARRIIWGKFLNAGQTCIAPDYLLVHQSIKDAFIEQCKKTLLEFYGSDMANSPDLARIVNERHFDRLSSLLKDANILVGGETDRDSRYIAPTLLDGVDWEHPVMQDEIFGPILPVLEFSDLNDAIETINSHPKPLALYFFSNDKSLQNKVIDETSSGGVCINDTINHIIPNNLPFGGVGTSGMGAYHGKASFDIFSHHKSTLKRSFLLDIKIKYAPYTVKIEHAKKLLKLMTG